jgi:hypothetical protein
MRRRVEEPTQCQLCDRKALYFAHTGPDRVVGACAEHRVIAVRVMLENAVHHDAKHQGALAAQRGTKFVERGYNVGKHSERIHRSK